MDTNGSIVTATKEKITMFDIQVVIWVLKAEY